jgi:hypothetical protein
MKRLAFSLFLYIFFGCALAPETGAQVKQSPEVIEVYQVLREYQQILSADLDFGRAFEATFTKNVKRQRAIAIADGEFGNEEDLKDVSDELLIKAYRQRMQIFYLMLALAGAGKTDSIIPLPPEIETIVRRDSPADAREFPAFVSQLEEDIAFLRSFIERASKENPAFAKSIEEFKSEKFEPPVDYKVTPTRGYYRGKVLCGDENFYEINGYSLIREQGKMKIIGIRFFTKLF